MQPTDAGIVDFVSMSLGVDFHVGLKTIVTVSLAQVGTLGGIQRFILITLGGFSGFKGIVRVSLAQEGSIGCIQGWGRVAICCLDSVVSVVTVCLAEECSKAGVVTVLQASSRGLWGRGGHDGIASIGDGGCCWR